MPLKKHLKALVIETPKQDIVLTLNNLEDNNKFIKNALAKAGKKLDLLKKTLRRLE
jgi:hypothetical protein